MKESEAAALTDFLMPMLQYYPEKRATAQSMLSHPWFNMPSNYDYIMTDREYERMMMIKKNKKEENAKETDDTATSDIIESDNELNLADDEDNEDYLSDENYESDDSGGEPDINIQNFNNSFAAYGQHVNLAALDRANPQFSRRK
jgi:serine/threonine protein kinase